MANEHIKTAAANLERAAQDVHDAKQRAKNDIDLSKRQAEDSIKRLNNQLQQLNRSKANPRVAGNEKLAIDVQRHNIHNEISQIEKNTKTYEQTVMRELSNMDGQENELHNLASHLNGIA